MHVDWVKERSRNGGADEVPLPAGATAGRLWLCGKHFVGAECVRKHGDPAKGIHSLQIEMNRGLYMDEAARTRSDGLARVRGHLAELARQLAAYARTKSRP